MENKDRKKKWLVFLILSVPIYYVGMTKSH